MYGLVDLLQIYIIHIVRLDTDSHCDLQGDSTEPWVLIMSAY